MDDVRDTREALTQEAKAKVVASRKGVVVGAAVNTRPDFVVRRKSDGTVVTSGVKGKRVEYRETDSINYRTIQYPDRVMVSVGSNE